MTTSPLRIRRPNEAELNSLYEVQTRQQVTYQPIGISSNETRGYHHDRAEMAFTVDSGATLHGASHALFNWNAHIGAGFLVYPPDTSACLGATILLCRKLAVGYVTLSCRVVQVINEPNRQGFAYGTLPLHLEQGEQRFVVEQESEGRVRFLIETTSRPTHPISRLGYPVTRLIQERAIRNYLLALATAATDCR